VAPGLRHRHNGPGSPGPLIEPLEGHPELPMFFSFDLKNTTFVKFLAKFVNFDEFLEVAKLIAIF